MRLAWVWPQPLFFLAQACWSPLLRNLIPKQVRIASYIVIIATFVTIVDYAIHALSLELYNALGAFIQLIVANCVILGRAEKYASKNRITKSLVNALVWASVSLSRCCVWVGAEILGSGTLCWFSTVWRQLPAVGGHDSATRGFFVTGAWLLLFLVAGTQAAQGGKEEEAIHAPGDLSFIFSTHS